MEQSSFFVHRLPTPAGFPVPLAPLSSSLPQAASSVMRQAETSVTRRRGELGTTRLSPGHSSSRNAASRVVVELGYDGEEVTRVTARSSMRTAVFAATLLAVGLSAGAASAEDGASGAEVSSASWRSGVGVGTDFPVSVGVRGQLEAPFRLRLSTSLGLLPGPYVDAINAFVVGVGGYGDSTADVIRSALSTSLVWRTHLGYRPWERLGLHFEAGHGLVALGGSATTSELLTAATGRALPSTDAGTSRSFDVASTLHMLDAEVGWDFPVAERFLLRASLGGAFTIASATSVTPDFQPRAPRAIAELSSFSEGYLDDLYTSYVFTPVIGVSASYVLF